MFRKSFFMISVVFVAVFLIGVSQSYANNFSGQTLQMDWLYPDQSTVYSTTSFLVGPGTEITSLLGYPMNVDVDDTSISLIQTGPGG
ncbi:MAG: hypothetical protein FJ241_08440 [Nitrospira sp.]|nr:hypothetical protein [Nitrospira sp.]